MIYKRDFEHSPLVAQPLTAAPARQVVPCVNGVNYAIGPAGIYYGDCSPGPQRSIHLLEKTGRDRVLGTIRDAWPFYNRLAVAPDGKTILVERQTLSNDLMLIENFR